MPTAVPGKGEGTAAGQALHHPEQDRVPGTNLAHHGCGSATFSSEWFSVRLALILARLAQARDKNFERHIREVDIRKTFYIQREEAIEKNMPLQADSEAAHLYKKYLYFFKYEDYMQQIVLFSPHTTLMGAL